MHAASSEFRAVKGCLLLHAFAAMLGCGASTDDQQPGALSDTTTRAQTVTAGIAQPQVDSASTPITAAATATADKVQSYDNVPVVFRAERELRIDGTKGSADQLLTSVGGLKIDRRGTIYAAQVGERRISVFDSTGKWIRNLGRPGEGPGEFAAMALFGFKGDSLWVADPDQSRITLFQPNGNVARIITAQVPPPHARYRATAPLAYLSNDRILARILPTQTQGYSDSTRLPDLLVRASTAGQIIDTAFVLELPWVTLVRDEGTSMQTRVAIPSTPYFVMGEDGSQFVVVERSDPRDTASASFTVHRLGVTAAAHSRTQFSYTPRPVPQRLIDSITPEPKADEHPTQQSIRRLMRKYSYFPKFLPAVNLTIVGRDGTLWLACAWEENRNRWTILNSNDRIVGAVDVPIGFRLLQADMNHLWGTETDESGVSSIVRYRLVQNR